jgi:hypothetical protein
VTVGGRQEAVAARLPGAAALGLQIPPSAVPVPAVRLTDAGWTAGLLAARARQQGIDDRRVAATLWWYSVSSVLVTPALAGAVTGIPLSARLADLSICFRPGGLLVAAVSSAAGGRLSADLRESLSAVVGAVAEAGRMRERPLWAIATDSIANRLLDLGRALGEVERATGLAVALGAAVGPPLPVPRYEDVAGVRFTRRASCCLVYRLPSGALCTSCPRRPPAERRRLLEDAAARL